MPCDTLQVFPSLLVSLHYQQEDEMWSPIANRQCRLLLLFVLSISSVVDAFQIHHSNACTGARLGRWPLSSNTDENPVESAEAEELQLKLNKIIEETPMFGSFDTDNFDESALPIPTFTALIVTIASLAWTYYLFDIGINGFPSVE